MSMTAKEKIEYVRNIFFDYGARHQRATLLKALEEKGINIEAATASRFANGTIKTIADISKIFDVVYNIVKNDDRTSNSVIHVDISSHISKFLNNTVVYNKDIQQNNTSSIDDMVGIYRLMRHAWMYGSNKKYVIATKLTISKGNYGFIATEEIDIITKGDTLLGVDGQAIKQKHSGLLFKTNSGVYAILEGCNAASSMFMSMHTHMSSGNYINVIRGTLTSILPPDQIYSYKFEATRNDNFILDANAGIIERKKMIRQHGNNLYY